MLEHVGVALLALTGQVGTDVGDLVKAYDKEFCQIGASRLTTYQITTTGIELVSTDIKKDVDFSVDGPIPMVTVTRRRWESVFQGGNANLWNLRFDYRAGTDQSSSELILTSVEGLTRDIIEKNIAAPFQADISVSGRIDRRVATISSEVGKSKISLWARMTAGTNKAEWVISCQVYDY